jgi:hypothetical protein
MSRIAVITLLVATTLFNQLNIASSCEGTVHGSCAGYCSGSSACVGSGTSCSCVLTNMTRTDFKSDKAFSDYKDQITHHHLMQYLCTHLNSDAGKNTYLPVKYSESRVDDTRIITDRNTDEFMIHLRCMWNQVHVVVVEK